MHMTKPLISIIVPIYNVEKYLDRCLKSLLCQTYSAIEIILVDDGSPDNCPTMCDEYAEKYQNIVVIHKPNGGLSSARNAGVAKAKGDYIAFVDSDDWVSEDAYEYAMGLMIKHNADCVQFNYKMVSDLQTPKQPKEEVVIFHEKDILQYYLDSSTRTGSYSVWKCLFHRNLVESIRFREGRINEDIDYKYKVLNSCHCLAVSNQYKYFYFQSGDTLSTGGMKKRDFDLYEAADELCLLTEREDYGKIRFLGRVKKARTPFSLLCKIAFYGVHDDSIDKKALTRQLCKEHRKNVGILLRAPMPISRKFLTIGFAVSYSLTKAVIDVAKVLGGGWML